MKTIGLVGVGAMGEPIGATLLRAGMTLRICAHRRRERVDRLIAAGAVEASDPAAVADGCDVLIMALPDSPQVEEALFGSRGAAPSLRRGSYVIDMSTISPVASRDFHKRLAERGVAMIDAPVSGGPARAADGTLAIMAGGEPESYAACEPILRLLGTPTRVGPPGMGETVKLVNQIIISSVMIANIEGMLFAKKAGADIDLVRRVIGSATGSNYILEKWLPQTWFAGSHKGGFALDLLRKDLNAALKAAETMGLSMVLSTCAAQRYGEAARDGLGADDYSAVAVPYERAAGVNITD
ncbi:MAG TPA: NAD(P)-dependent oxidoreductase [Candidatus Eremiobacteraceae bacterium]|nr:NAD(P)-dependent oxidoreductase [Candidatus Eremiobacteraceae bacterium]